MALICSYCGSECGPRDQANGRCGSCACFFTGNEEIIPETPDGEASVTEDDSLALPFTKPNSLRGKEKRQETDRQDKDPQTPGKQPPGTPNLGSAPSQFDPTAVEPMGPVAGFSNSEGLIQPRRLSPQFRRRVEKTWQSTFAGGHTAESTLSSHTPSSETKSESPTLSIATRKITKAAGGAKSASEGDYELKEVIGEGSMGRVWSARQTSLDRDVAVKVPMAELTGAGSVGESQFISEVVVTGKLEHPNIVPIYELGRDSTGVPFYSMKHVQGRPWNEFIKENTDQENLEILMKVCDAIAFAHDRNFLHRDIKPHNVMVGEFGEVSVMDWGIAVSITKDPDQPWASIATGPAGTPAYMAPEMAAHNPSELGVVSDVYLLGAVLYEIVTGTPPHPRTGDTGEALLSAAANEIIPTTKTGELVDIARRAMATKLEDRYQSVQELQDAIREYQSHRESIKLSESAEEHFANALEQHSSDEFARSRFAFEEAIKLWDGNVAAVNGLRLATLAHAKNSLDQENYELGISVLDAKNPEHQELLTKLESKRAARRRLAWFSKIAAATAVLAVVCVVGVTLYAYFQAQKTAKQLQANATTLKENADKLQLERDNATTAKKIAETARDVAFQSQREARRLEGEARLEKRRAEEAPYASEIGLAAESIRRNLFDKAEKILDKLDPTKPDFDPVMSQLRHIEWGLLKQSWAPSTVKSLFQEDRIESVGSSSDGATIAAGTEDGTILLWSGLTGLESLPDPTSIAFGEKLNAIAVSSDGRYLAAAGILTRSPDRDPLPSDFDVRLWEITSEGELVALPPLHRHTAEVLSVSFSNDSQSLVTSAADRTAVVWDRRDGNPIAVMPDHLDNKIWNARFSPSGTMVVTACEDGRVRVWEVVKTPGRVGEAKKLYDFRGHGGPVYAAVFSPDGRSVISGGYDRRLLKWTLSAAQADVVADSAELIKSRLASKSGSAPLDSVGQDEIGTPSDRHTASIQTISVGNVAGEQCILSGGNDNTIRVWRPSSETWKLDKVLSGHGRWVRSCVFSQQGQTVFSGAHDGIKLWAWQSYSMPRELIPETEGRLGRQPSERGLSNALKSIYSKDNRWVATVYANGTVEVWDLSSPDRATGTTLVEGHAMLAATGVFFDDGKQLLTSAGDNTTRLWDVPRGTHTQKLTGTGYRGAAALSWQSDSETALVVTGSDDRNNAAWFWQIKPGQEPIKTALLGGAERIEGQPLLGATADPSRPSRDVSLRLASSSPDRILGGQRRSPDVTTITFSPSGELFLIGDSAGNCFVFDVNPQMKQPGLRTSFRAHRSAVSCAAFLPNSQSLITAGADGEMLLWDTANWNQRGTLPWSGPVTSLDVSSNGDQLIVGHAPLEGSEFPIVELFRVHGDTVASQATLLSRDAQGHRDWTANQPTVRSVQFTRGDDQAVVSLFFPAHRVEKNGSPTAASDAIGYRVGYWNWSNSAADFATIRSNRLGEVSSAVLDEDLNRSQLLVVGGKGARLIAADDDQRLSFSRLTKSFRPASKISAADFSYDPTAQSSTRLVVGDSEGNVQIWELDGGQWSENTAAAVHMAGQHDAPIMSTSFDPGNPNRLITADRSGVCKLWDFETQWNLRSELQTGGASDALNFAMFSPDGKSVLVGTDAQALLWRRDEQDQFQRVLDEWKPGKIQSAAYAEDGSWIVTSDGDRTVAVWSAQGDLLARMDEEDASGTTTMALSYDRRRLVSGQGKRIVIWDTSRILEAVRARGLAAQDQNLEKNASSSSGGLVKELFTLRSDSDVTSVSISPNGRHLLSSGMNGQTTIWEGTRIAPISLSFSNDQFSIQRDAAFKNIGESAYVSDPSRIADFGGARLRVSIRGQRFSGEALAIRPLADLLGASILTRIEQGQTVLYHRVHLQADPKRIGVLQTDSQNLGTLQVQFNDRVDARNVQSLLRALAYRIGSEPDSATGDLVPEAATPSPDADRIIDVKISGIRYRSNAQEESLDASPEQTTDAGTIERTIKIEVEPENVVDNVAASGESEIEITHRMEEVLLSPTTSAFLSLSEQ